MQIRKLLVRATNWVGDAVMSLPALQALHSNHPEIRLSILARPWVADIYAREPFASEIISYEGKFPERLRRALRLHSQRFDGALLLQNAFEAALVAWLARIPVRIGYNRDARGLLLTHPISVPAADEIPKHQRFYYLELLKRSGLIPSYSSVAPIRLQGADAENGRSFLQTVSPARSFIAVCPGAAYGDAKRWLPERFAETAFQVARETNDTVLVLGAESEAEVCRTVHRQITTAGIQSIYLAGQTDLSLFIDVAAACRLLITNDSGAMHIGYAVGVPTVTIFGSTDHEATGPSGPLATVIREPVECSPCLLRECPIDHRCMTRVNVDRVASVALKVLHG